MKTKVLQIILPLLALPGLALAQTSPAGASLNLTSFTSALLLVAVVIGVLANLWRITQKWGGLIGAGLRLIGIGIVFLSIEALDRAVTSIAGEGILTGILGGTILESAVHDLLLVLALFFVTLGFTKFYSAVKV